HRVAVVGTPLFQVDAFATGPFSGNPAAVCVLERPADPAWMQSVAAEMNLSETAFVHPLHSDDAGRFGLRWFTPTVEVDLCARATLARGHVLWDPRRLPGERAARFETRGGVPPAPRPGEGVALALPADLVTPAEPDPGLLEAVGIADAVA